jgi:hypothetical protein
MSDEYLIAVHRDNGVFVSADLARRVPHQAIHALSKKSSPYSPCRVSVPLMWWVSGGVAVLALLLHPTSVRSALPTTTARTLSCPAMLPRTVRCHPFGSFVPIDPIGNLSSFDQRGRST